jgi:hypothetical protein
MPLIVDLRRIRWHNLACLSLVRCAHSWDIMFNTRNKSGISANPCIILYLLFVEPLASTVLSSSPGALICCAVSWEMERAVHNRPLLASEPARLSWSLGTRLFQEYNILMKAYVVLEFGMVPNCLSSILTNIAGFKCCSTTNSPETFDKTGINDNGRKLYQRITAEQYYRELRSSCSSFSCIVT